MLLSPGWRELFERAEAKDVRRSAEDIAESYRIKLRLQPWSEHNGVVVNGMLRRSGKTTRLILQALAECAADPELEVVIGVDKMMVCWTNGYVQDLADRLGVDRSRVKVATHAGATRATAPVRGERQKKIIELHDLP